MQVDFNKSETKNNLMRAFAGESMARNRYTFAAEEAKKQKLEVIEAVFKYTAGQEKEHAAIFYDYLNGLGGETIDITASYPVDLTTSIIQLLRYAQNNEYNEYEDAYPAFAKTAQNEGFLKVAQSFTNIASIEKSHGDRFGRFADLLEQNKLFVSDIKCRWICLNCGHISESNQAPDICPVCHHNKGYFIRLEMSPYES